MTCQLCNVLNKIRAIEANTVGVLYVCASVACRKTFIQIVAVVKLL